MKNLSSLLFASLLMFSLSGYAQCISTVQVGNYTANGSSFSQQQVFSCNFAGDYAIVTIPGGIWTFSTSVSTDFITITNTSNGVLATGTGSVQYGASSTITVRMHIFQNSACDEQTSCRTSYVQQNEIPVPQISASDTFVCSGEGPVTLTASNLFGAQTYWYAGSCNSTPIDSGSSTVVDPSSSTTYFANNLFNGGLGECDSFTVVITPLPTVTISTFQNVLCHGDSTGFATASVSGGSSPYSYAWSTGQNGATINDLDTGSYEVIVADSFGCADTTSVLITQPDPLNSTISVISEPLCHGAATGSAQAMATGGVAPYSYFWTNGSNSALLDSVPGGTYVIDIMDSNGCLIKDTTVINEPFDINISLSQSIDVDCPGGTSGYIEVVAFGGTGTLSYNWSNGSTSPVASNLTAGVYNLVITDVNGCTKTFTDTISDPDALSSVFDVTNAVCHDSENGAAQISNTGGTAPYSYLWSTGGTGNTISDLDTGVYTVTITDDSNCVYFDTIEVDFTNQDPSIPLDSSMILCSGFEVTLDAGNAGSTFDWSTGANTQSIQVDSGGMYSVVVTDPNGCSSEALVVVVEDDCVGIDEVALDQYLKVYPNPTNGVINLVLSDNFAGQNEVLLMNVHGSVIQRSTLTGDRLLLDLNGLTKGVYLLQVKHMEGVSSKQIILQ
ncbi:MAG: T9SS type A sorting domain-containing protein [Cryomorphaceae bacterium]